MFFEENVILLTNKGVFKKGEEYLDARYFIRHPEEMTEFAFFLAEYDLPICLRNTVFKYYKTVFRKVKEYISSYNNVAV